MSSTLIFAGRNRVRYDYARFGYTRGGGKTWHGGLDIEALDDTTIRMPYYDGKAISGTVTRARRHGQGHEAGSDLGAEKPGDHDKTRLGQDRHKGRGSRYDGLCDRI